MSVSMQYRLIANEHRREALEANCPHAQRKQVEAAEGLEGLADMIAVGHAKSPEELTALLFA